MTSGVFCRRPMRLVRSSAQWREIRGVSDIRDTKVDKLVVKNDYETRRRCCRARMRRMGRAQYVAG